MVLATSLICSHALACTRTHALQRTRSLARARSHMLARTCSHARAHTHALARMCSHARARMHARARTRSHARVRTRRQIMFNPTFNCMKADQSFPYSHSNILADARSTPSSSSAKRRARKERTKSASVGKSSRLVWCKCFLAQKRSGLPKL